MNYLMIILALAAGPNRSPSEDSGRNSALLAAPSQTNVGKSVVAISRQTGRVSITFTEILQSATSSAGPWTDVQGASSPFEEKSPGQQRFFRSRGPESIFASGTVVAFTLTGPFQIHFDRAYAGTPDGIIPPLRQKPFFDGMLQMSGAGVPVSLRVRGNSSLQECPFPKLKLKVSKEQRAGTPFFDAREIKIGTHCAEGGRGPIGRLRDETAAYREALAYETMSEFGFIAPRVRRARIDYQDTTPPNSSPMSGWQVTRNAVILDDIEIVAERLGGRALDDDEVAALTKAGFDEQLIADLQFLHALLGNWDYRLSQDGRGLWNTDVIELENGKLVPVAGDFDLCSWVTETVRLSAPQGYHPELGDVERQARYELEQIHGRVSGPAFAAASKRFTSKRTAVESRIASALIDEPGRTNARRHVTAFFDALAEGIH